MLIELNGAVINTDSVRKFERLPKRGDEPYHRIKVTWTDGETEIIDASFTQVEQHSGRYIPAAAGFQEITAYIEGDEVGFFEPMPVIGFRVTGQSSYDVRAVSLEGEAGQWHNGEDELLRATVFPDGRCYCHAEGSLPIPLEDWKKQITRTLLRKASEAKS